MPSKNDPIPVRDLRPLDPLADWLERWGLSRNEYVAMACRGDAPPPLRTGRRTWLLYRDEAEAWEETRRTGKVEAPVPNREVRLPRPPSRRRTR